MSEQRTSVRAILHRLTPDFLYPRCCDCGRSMLYCINCERLICVDCNHMAHILHMTDVYIPVLDKVAGTHLWNLHEVWNDIISLWLALPLNALQRRAFAVGIAFSYVALVIICWGQWLAMVATLILHTIAMLCAFKGVVSIQSRLSPPDTTYENGEPLLHPASMPIEYPCIFSEPSPFPHECSYTVSHTIPFVVVINGEAQDFVLQHDRNIYWVQFYAASMAEVEVQG